VGPKGSRAMSDSLKNNFEKIEFVRKFEEFVRQ
jgi:hypothetical protein